ncbi:MAG: transcription elongation factor GreA [Thermoguttaceae bacterium]|jgi:transcription elongation factor GreA|nr:transcription elongation factor GreA [Thermoguttaceae bacterium]
MYDPIPMTNEGYARLNKEIERLERDEIPPILERIAIAREEGDLSENAEYHGARETLALLKAKIADLKDRIGRAQIIDPSAMPQDEIRFGATIVVKRMRDKKELTYTLVGAGEEDFEVGKILCTCPLAQSFLGKKVGDSAEFKSPRGVQTFKIMNISYEL